MNVCVIIPFWNGSKWIERALESIARQTIAPAEVLVINDGSRDEERRNLGELTKKYQFKILDKDNGGQGTARNHGVQHSTADLISFLDQDDYYLPEHIERLLSQVPNDLSRFGFAYGSFHIGDEAGNIQIENHLEKNQKGLHPPSKDPLDLISRNLFILPSASIISRKAFMHTGGFDPQFRGYEDDDLFSRIITSGFEYTYTPVPLYVWCQHKSSTSWSPVMLESQLRYYSKVRSLHTQHGRLASRTIATKLMMRFGKSFYKAALTNSKAPNGEPSLEMRVFSQYLTDALSDNLSAAAKIGFILKFILTKISSIPPISTFISIKNLNRQRIEKRRIRQGQRFL